MRGVGAGRVQQAGETVIGRAQALQNASAMLEVVNADLDALANIGHRTSHPSKEVEALNRYITRNTQIAIAYSLYATAIEVRQR